MLTARAAMVGKDNPLPTPSGIAFESVVPGTYAGVTAVSWTHTLAVPVNCLLVGVSAQANFNPSMSIDTGQKFTQLGSFFYTHFSNIWFELYGLMNPTIGTRTITVTVTVPVFAGFGCGGSSIAYSGVSGFAATGTNLIGNTTSLGLGVPAFPGAVAVKMTNSAFASTNQTSRQTTGVWGWQESTDNTGYTRRFSTTWPGAANYGAVAVVLR